MGITSNNNQKDTLSSDRVERAQKLFSSAVERRDHVFSFVDLHVKCGAGILRLATKALDEWRAFQSSVKTFSEKLIDLNNAAVTEVLQKVGEMSDVVESLELQFHKPCWKDIRSDMLDKIHVRVHDLLKHEILQWCSPAADDYESLDIQKIISMK